MSPEDVQVSVASDKRRNARIQPDPDSPVLVTLTGDPDSVQAQVECMDISASGVGLRVQRYVETALAGTNLVRLTIVLPGSQQPLHLTGVIRNRRPTDDSGAEIVYGVQFDWDRSENAERQQNAIVKFVMDRQRQGIRR